MLSMLVSKSLHVSPRVLTRVGILVEGPDGGALWLSPRADWRANCFLACRRFLWVCSRDYPSVQRFWAVLFRIGDVRRGLANSSTFIPGVRCHTDASHPVLAKAYK